MSSRTAACGHPPVSMARIRCGGRAELRVRNSASSRVKMSFVTQAIECVERRARQRASIRAVLPEPTGLRWSGWCQRLLGSYVGFWDTGEADALQIMAGIPTNAYGEASFVPVSTR